MIANPSRYRDTRGSWHELEVRKTAGGWQVLDIDGEHERVIETLTGIGDGRPQADAIACDYLATVGGCSAESEAPISGAGHGRMGASYSERASSQVPEPTERRRDRILFYLQNADAPVTARTLAEQMRRNRIPD